MPHKVEPNEQAAHYDRWFREQVEAGLSSRKPLLTHDQAAALVDAQLTERRISRLAQLAVQSK